MKILFDENISYRIVKKLQDHFPESKHVSDISPILQSDEFIFKYAKENDFTIATFDEDFENISVSRGAPPKIIWLRMGNTSTIKISERFIESKQMIRTFIESDDSVILELY
jgi:predicted nuclease of predicted toxin-antitoxin system